MFFVLSGNKFTTLLTFQMQKQDRNLHNFDADFFDFDRYYPSIFALHFQLGPSNKS